MKLGGGGRFKKVVASVAKGYEKKGMPAKKAKAIGGAVAAKIGREKYGKGQFQKLAKLGKKKKTA